MISSVLVQLPGFSNFIIIMSLFCMLLIFISYLQYTGKRLRGLRSRVYNPRLIGIIYGFPFTFIIGMYLIYEFLSANNLKMELLVPFTFLFISGIFALFGSFLSEPFLSPLKIQKKTTF
ncbi:MAG: hypothetical protein ACFFD7_01135 [Candidatus Thorarchaeota archaeon]